jgi:hypothetical protein
VGNYVFDTTMFTWSPLTLNYTQTGISCSSQAPSSPTTHPLYIYGGNNAEFNQYKGGVLTNLSSPLAAMPLSSVGCAATPVDNFIVFGGMKGPNCSNEVFLYNPTSRWNVVNTNSSASAPQARYGSAVVSIMNGFIVIGGACQNTIYNDIWTFTFTNNNNTTGIWKLETVNVGGVFYASAVPSVNNSVVIFGGKTSLATNASTNAVYLYYPSTQQVSSLMTNLPSPRSQASLLSNGNRVFVYGGIENNTYSDIWQLVSQKYCLVLGCNDCVSTVGCGWCSSNTGGLNCVAGNATATYVNGTCTENTSYASSTSQCPNEFPSWAIALIVIGGVVFIGIIVFAIMKFKNKSDYHPVKD